MVFKSRDLKRQAVDPAPNRRVRTSMYAYAMTLSEWITRFVIPVHITVLASDRSDQTGRRCPSTTLLLSSDRHIDGGGGGICWAHQQ